MGSFAATMPQVKLGSTTAKGRVGEAWSQQKLRPGRSSSSLQQPKPGGKVGSHAQEQCCPCMYTAACLLAPQIL